MTTDDKTPQPETGAGVREMASGHTEAEAEVDGLPKSSPWTRTGGAAPHAATTPSRYARARVAELGVALARVSGEITDAGDVPDPGMLDLAVAVREVVQQRDAARARVAELERERDALAERPTLRGDSWKLWLCQRCYDDSEPDDCAACAARADVAPVWLVTVEHDDGSVFVAGVFRTRESACAEARERVSADDWQPPDPEWQGAYRWSSGRDVIYVYEMEVET